MGTSIISPEHTIERIRTIVSPIYPFTENIISPFDYEKFLGYAMRKLMIEKRKAQISENPSITMTGNLSRHIEHLKSIQAITDKFSPLSIDEISGRVGFADLYDDIDLATFSVNLAKQLDFNCICVNSGSDEKKKYLSESFNFLNNENNTITGKNYYFSKNNPKNGKNGIIMMVTRHKSYAESHPKKTNDYLIIANNRFVSNRREEKPPIILDTRGLEVILDDKRDYLSIIQKIINFDFLKPTTPPSKRSIYTNNTISGVSFIDYIRQPKKEGGGPGDGIVDPTNGNSYRSAHLYVLYRGKIIEIKLTPKSAYIENQLNPYFGWRQFRNKQTEEINRALNKS